MSTHLPSQDEQSANAASAEKESQAAMPSQSSASQPLLLPSQPEEDAFYFEEEQPDLETAFVAPFQLSGATPMMTAPGQPSNQSSAIPSTPSAPPTKTKRKPRLSLTMVAILVCVVVIVGLFVMNALGQATAPLQTRVSGSSQTTQPAPQKPTGNQQPSTAKPAQAAAQTNGMNGQGQTPGQATPDWVPQQLPNGWTNAGLQPGDSIQAIRTAVAFNDREMSLDYRSVGTRNNHGGTFTAAVFVMTTAAKQRFQRNDVRESNDTLFDMVVTTKLIRLVVNPQPQLVKFAQVGQQQFAWVEVTFQLWQSQTNPNHPQQRIEGKELDPATNQPRVHHMMVLLLRVPAQDAGNNPAMGGTGWLVSNYALDLPNNAAPDIVQPA